jgi:glycerophosphoryl diester phosphodiesterase
LIVDYGACAQTSENNILKIFGHRGAAGEAPENTIAGLRHAIERGVRFIDLDIQHKFQISTLSLKSW